LATPPFQRSPRQSAFLRFVVEKALAGEADQIKEYEIAVQVYGRSPDHSTRVDPIVRVEAARLRSKLLEYYAGAGAGELMRISLPKGSYVPEFTLAEAGPAALSAPPERQRVSFRLPGAVLAVIAAAFAIWAVTMRSNGSPAIAPGSKIPAS